MTLIPINLRDKLASFGDLWSPRVVAELNDYQFKLVKLHGEFVCGQQRNREQRASDTEPARHALELTAPLDPTRLATRGLECRHQRCQHRGHDSEGQSMNVHPNRWRGGGERATKRQIVHRAQNQVDQTAGVKSHLPPRRLGCRPGKY
jgi:hypothetical protein